MEDLYRTLPKLLRAAGDAEEVAEAAVMIAWRRAAGDIMRISAVPFRLYRKTLVVAVPDEAWQKQLDHMRWQLLKRLNQMLEQTMVTNIEFRIDPATVKAERERLRRPATDHAEQEEQALRRAKDLRSAASEIQDEELRQRFLLAAGTCLNRRDEEL